MASTTWNAPLQSSPTIALLRAALVALAIVASGCGARSTLWDPAGEGDSRPRIHVADARGFQGPGRISGFEDMKGTGWSTFEGNGRFFGICSPTLDDAGRIYFVNNAPAATGVVRIDDMTGANLAMFGSRGTGEGQFLNPRGVALDAQGRIYVADAGAHRVSRVDDMSGAGWVSFGGLSPGVDVGQFNEPSSIAISADGKILVADQENHRIVQMDDMSGAGWRVWSPPGAGPSAGFAWGVAYDEAQRIYTVDFGLSLLHRMDSIDGEGLVTFLSEVQASHVFVAPGGRIYMTLLNGDHVVTAMDDMSGANLETFGGPGEGTDHFTNPCGIVVR
jgi:DNA-binding beta-propeller fold protein YncE